VPFPADASGGANLRAADQWLSIPVVTGKAGVPAVGLAMGVPELVPGTRPGTRLGQRGDGVMSYHDGVTLEPGKRGSKPCIRGMRITVYDVLDWMAQGMTEQQITRAWWSRIFALVWPLRPTASIG
jgi:hypothetical protein